MCDPISLLVVGGLASTAATISSSKKAEKSREREAAEAKKAADAEKRTADLDARQSRNEDYDTRRKVRVGSSAGAASPFSPRSFFNPA